MDYRGNRLAPSHGEATFGVAELCALLGVKYCTLKLLLRREMVPLDDLDESTPQQRVRLNQREVGLPFGIPVSCRRAGIVKLPNLVEEFQPLRSCAFEVTRNASSNSEL